MTPQSQNAFCLKLYDDGHFLGLGLPVTEPSLGSLIANGFEYLLSGQPWISILPGFILLLTVIGINLVGDQLRDILNPRLQR